MVVVSFSVAAIRLDRSREPGAAKTKPYSTQTPFAVIRPRQSSWQIRGKRFAADRLTDVRFKLVSLLHNALDILLRRLFRLAGRETARHGFRGISAPTANSNGMEKHSKLFCMSVGPEKPFPERRS